MEEKACHIMDTFGKIDCRQASALTSVVTQAGKEDGFVLAFPLIYEKVAI